MKKYMLYLLLLIAAFGMLGCSKKKGNSNDQIKDLVMNDTPIITPTETPTPTEVPVVSHDGEMRSTLSGLWVPIEIGNKRPYAYVFNNFKTVRNQWGIGQADIVYEALVEGGITRFLGIGENFTGDKLGSARSARHYFVSVADEYDAIYIHFGKTKYATAKFKALKMDHMDGSEGIGDTVFYRDKSIPAPHNAFASLEGILAGVKKMKFRTEHNDGYESHFRFYEEDTNLTATTPVNKVSVHFSSYSDPYLEYHEDDKLYYHFQFGEKHVDSLTGEQIAFKNIIIQFVKERDIDHNGYQTMDFENADGTGYYITNGNMRPITWKKNESTKYMRYFDEAGEALTINPGKTYIALFPDNRKDDIVIK